MPRLLCGIFRKRRELLLDLSQCAAEALAEYMRRHLGAQARPGIVVSITTSGDLTCCSQVMGLFLDIHTTKYGDNRQVVWDMAEAMNEELLALRAAGCPVIQIE